MPGGELQANELLSSSVEALAAIVSASRDAIWSWAPDGTIVSWNHEAERLFGYRAEEILGQSLFVLVPEERHERAKAAMSNLGRGEWIGQYETERVHKDGSRIPVELTVSPIRDAEGRTVGAATICRDITKRMRAEMARQWLAAIVDFSDDAIVAKDLNGVIQSWNRGAQQLFGYTSDEVVGRPITTIIPPDRQHEEADILERVRRGEHVAPFETVRQRKDGSLVDVSLTISPVKNAAGEIVGASKIARDTSERKEAERHRELLARELDHRVKNLLAVVQAMANQTFTGNRDPQDALQAFRGRLRALSAAHDLLVRDHWQEAQLDALIRNILEAVGQTERSEIDGPSVRLEPRVAVTFSIALHELCTNAIKYGALSAPTGTVSLTWAVAGSAEPLLTLHWKERGGPSPSPPERRGFGTRMIEEVLAYDLGGKVSLEFDPAGLNCTISLPLPRDP